MSSESAKRFESLQREFNAYVEHITQEAKATKKKKQAVAEPAVATDSAPPVVVAEPVAKKRGRKPKEAAVVAVAC